MKKIALLLAVVPLFAICQLPTKTIGSNEVTIDYNKKIPYDGRQNNLGKHFMKYLDEELYLPCSIYGAEGYRKEAFALGDKSKENNYYKVVKISKPKGEINLHDAEFKLVQKGTNDTVIYNYMINYDFPFITVKYFQYIKSKYLNKQQVFTYKDIVVNEDFKFEDFKTKKEVPIFEKKLFTIIDVFISIDKDCGIYMVLKSGNITLLHKHEFEY